jgi:hypothetical protein
MTLGQFRGETCSVRTLGQFLRETLTLQDTGRVSKKDLNQSGHWDTFTERLRLLRTLGEFNGNTWTSLDSWIVKTGTLGPVGILGKFH